MFPRFIKVAAEKLDKVCHVSVDGNGKTTFSGIEGELLNLLSQSLHFNYSVQRPKDREWGSLKDDGNWTGMVGMISREEVDIGLCIFTVTEHRKRVIDFSEPYAYDELTFATNLPQSLPKMNLILTAFHWKSWLGIFAILIFMSFVFRTFQNTNLSCLGVLFILYGSILRQSCTKKVFHEKNILNACWWLFAPLLAIIYAAAFYSFLTILPKEKVITNFLELSDAVKRGQYRAMTVKGSFIKDLLKSMDVKYINEIAVNMERHSWFLDQDEYYNYTRNSLFLQKTAVVDAGGLFQLYFGKESLVTKFISKDNIQDTSYAIAVRKSFCCKKKLDTQIMRIKRSGLYQNILSREIYRTYWKFASEDKSNGIEHELTLDDISGTLIALIAGYNISLMALVTEICFEKLLRAV